MKKPLIGLTPGHNTDTEDIFLRPTYLKALTAAGAIPFILPLEPLAEDETQIAETFDGFVFTGGPDPHPFLFGEETHKHCGNVSIKRDSMETALLSCIIKTRKPILGICRGIQIINIGLGGTIYQDIVSEYIGHHSNLHENHDQKGSIKTLGNPSRNFPLSHMQPFPYHTPSHTVTLSPKSRLVHICACHSLKVNSMHHQAVKDLAPGLSACALSSDGLVEALEMPDYPWFVAVQWHPEYLWENDPAAARLFKSFVDACRH